MRIRIHQFRSMPMRIRIQGFEDSMKIVQVTEEAFSPQKRTSSTSKMKFLHFFLFLWVIFALPDLMRVQIQTHNTENNMDDKQSYGSGFSCTWVTRYGSKW